VSVALQYGVPLETYVEKFTNMRFEPAGLTDDPDMRMAQSIMDYVFRRLALDHLDFDTRSFYGIHTADERTRQLETGSYDMSDRRAPTTRPSRTSSRTTRLASVPAAEEVGRHEQEAPRPEHIDAAAVTGPVRGRLGA
jgi:ribonucleoside-diphosphate reductase alpha chain